MLVALWLPMPVHSRPGKPELFHDVFSAKSCVLELLNSLSIFGALRLPSRALHKRVVNDLCCRRSKPPSDRNLSSSTRARSIAASGVSPLHREMLMARRATGSSFRGVDSSINLSTVMSIFPRSTALMFVRALIGTKSPYASPRTKRTTRIVAAILRTYILVDMPVFLVSPCIPKTTRVFVRYWFQRSGSSQR